MIPAKISLEINSNGREWQGGEASMMERSEFSPYLVLIS